MLSDNPKDIGIGQARFRSKPVIFDGSQSLPVTFGKVLRMLFPIDLGRDLDSKRVIDQNSSGFPPKRESFVMVLILSRVAKSAWAKFSP